MDNLQACLGDSPSVNELLAPDPRIQGGRAGPWLPPLLLLLDTVQLHEGLARVVCLAHPHIAMDKEAWRSLG